MVRATRSTAAHQNQQPTAEAPNLPTKKQNKKRKRTSTSTEPEEKRTAKQPRFETNQEHEEPGTGDLPLDPQDAAKILDVLEM